MSQWTSSTLEVIPLGAGCEVGRSCILLSFRGKKILFDCGIHPAQSGLTSLPVFDEISLREVDLCLVTHFHLDHCGAVPYLLKHTWFNGRVIMTEPTKAIAHLVWNDYASFSKHLANSDPNAAGGRNWLFSEADVTDALDSIETMHFGERLFHNGIEVTCFGAGHVVGACMFAVKIGGISVLYTGDYSAEDDRHVPRAMLPPSFSVQLLICESTYGIRKHEEREARERRFLSAVEDVVVGRQGKCLLPIFALGRVQELLLILNEHWQRCPSLQKIPIIYLSVLSDRGMQVMREYAATYSGDFVRKKALKGQNAFSFKFVKSAKNVDDIRGIITSDAPCVVLAAPGMLQSGPSREIFEMWAPDRRNGVILTGYTLRGTLADQLKGVPSSINRSDGREIPVRSSFEMISFSAHADFQQTNDLIDSILPPSVILVHGEKAEMRALQEKLMALRPSLSVFTPQILQKIVLVFPEANSCVAIGDLCEELTSIKRDKSHAGKQTPAVLIARPNTELSLTKAEEVGTLLGLEVSSLEIVSEFVYPKGAITMERLRTSLTEGGVTSIKAGKHDNQMILDDHISLTFLETENMVTTEYKWSVTRESSHNIIALCLLELKRETGGVDGDFDMTRAELDVVVAILRQKSGNAKSAKEAALPLPSL